MDVLIVTADEDRAQNLTDSLEQAGHEIARAASPSEGLAHLKKGAPGCVVLETAQSGEELASFRSSLETRSPDRAIPVLPYVVGQDPETIVRGIGELLKAETDSRQEAPPIIPSPKTVLLIDDREIHRRRIATQLGSEDWRVLEADDGRKGALLIIDERIDCLLVSGLIAGKTTHGIIRSAAEIRKVHPNPFSILVLLDSDDAGLVSQFFEAGADDVVLRSAGAPSMFRRLQAALRLRGLLRENRRLKERIATLQSGVA